jgi:small-conductance mechanosensitive channel
VRLGDYIKLNSGEEGYVTDIGWRSTTIRIPANNLIIVPNAKLAQAIVTNYSLPEKRLGSNVVVTVSFESDPDRAEAVLLEVMGKAVGEVPGLLAQPAPSVAFEPGFVDSGIGLTANFHVEDFTSQGPVRNELRKRIFRRLREEGIEMPYPTRTVFLRGSRGKRTPDHT